VSNHNAWTTTELAVALAVVISAIKLRTMVGAKSE